MHIIYACMYVCMYVKGHSKIESSWLPVRLSVDERQLINKCLVVGAARDSVANNRASDRNISKNNAWRERSTFLPLYSCYIVIDIIIIVTSSDNCRLFQRLNLFVSLIIIFRQFIVPE